MTEYPVFVSAFALVALALFPLPSQAQQRLESENRLRNYEAAEALAPVVTASNLMDSERFWPYRVALREDWKPRAQTAPIRAGLPGVLIRVEESGRTARIDFGRDGVQRIPVSSTDLVDRANDVRTGQLRKEGPNFVYAMGARLLDSAADPVRAMRYDQAAGFRAYLTVFADPEGSAFSELAASLAPLRERDELMTIFLPQGGHGDAEVAAWLRDVSWAVPFVFRHLSEPYSRSLLTNPEGVPAIVLQSPEGRVLLEESLDDYGIAKLFGALEESINSLAAATKP